jgi:WhiB family redox-sensing transcriptional regulator
MIPDRRSSRLIWAQTDTTWMDRAACAGHPQRVFFPPGARGSSRAAKQICANCPVRDNCLNYAITTSCDYGVWGGLDEHERQQHRRKTRQ